MPDFDAIYDKLRASGMNDWVGGADPKEVGDACCRILLRHIPISAQTTLLDFGTGIGRVMLSLLRERPEVQAVTGIDIVPRMVTFCTETIAAEFPQTNFELLLDHNDHYERFKEGGRAKSRAELQNTYGGRFDAVFAFSVFTHIEVEDFVPTLRFVKSLLKPGGRFLFTVFALNPFSRAMIKQGLTIASFPNPRFEKKNTVLIGTPSDRLAFIAYDTRRLDDMMSEAGLVPCAIEYGEWRGGGFSDSYQDVIVCRRPFEWSAGEPGR